MSDLSVFGQPTSMLEIAGIITGLIGVWLTVRQNILCFPVGIINVIIYAFMFSSVGIRLYADAILQCIYLILLIYGWMNWKKNKQQNSTDVIISKRSVLQLTVTAVLSYISLAFFLQRFTNASLPWLDSALTVLSLIAQWMIAKRMIANWIIWIIVNIVYIPLYFYKGLPLTSVLYFVFLLLAIKGFYDWRKVRTTNFSS